MMISQIHQSVANHKNKILETYQYLHQNPELSWEEKNTTKFLCQELKKLNIPIQTFPDVTGLVACWSGDEEGPTVAIRADIDALWQNVNGKWKANHSCGHDAHATMVLFTIKVLIEIGYMPKGKIKIIFQPAEETGQGSKAFADRGVVDDVDYLLGIHVRPIQEIAFKQASPAIYHGASAAMKGKVMGVQAHAARPHLGVNVLDSIAAIIHAVNSIKVDPTVSSSAKVTMVKTEGKNLNIIPDEAEFGVDLRAQSNEVMTELVKKVKKAISVAASFNDAEVELEIIASMVAAIPNEWMERVVEQAIIEVYGVAGTCAPPITPGGEDFHFYSLAQKNVKATMIGLGTDLTPGLHHPHMKFNLSALEDGVKIMALSILNIFDKHHKEKYSNEG